MKKILIIMLALTCAFAMFSCGDDESVSLDGFKTAVNNTVPTVVNVSVEVETDLGALTSNFKTTYAADGSFVIDYSYEQFNTISSGDSVDVKSTITGQVTCDKDGNYSDGGAFVGKTTAATGVKLALVSKKMESVAVSADGNVLNATVKAANTKAVLGIEIASDVTLVITKAADKVVSCSMEYDKTTVTCSFQ